VVITARPSYSRVKTALQALEARKDIELSVVCAGAALVTRFGRIVDQIRDDGFNVAAEVPCVVEGGGTRESAISTGLALIQLSGALGAVRPHIVVSIADRHETLATAIAASYQNIRLCHIQGGEVSGSIDDKVRNAVTQLADIHLVATEKAEQAVRRMHSHANVMRTGCPGIDLAREARKLGSLPGHDVVVLQHPDTNEADMAGAQMHETIKALSFLHPEQILWFWPGEDAGNEDMAKQLRMAGVKPVRNMPPVKFLRTLMGSGVLVGNSSVGIRECSFLGVPVVNVGDRQANRERGANVVDVGYDYRAIRAEVDRLMGKSCPPVELYGDGKAGKRIAEVLANGATA
jgi:UDP-hydrolysing UDP-N-acetyl-D-glucosamine 2-epimerase